MSVTTVSEAQIKQRSGEYDLQQVRYLVLERCQLNSLNNITSCIGLVELSLARNEIVDVAGLVTLVNLEKLDISYNQLRRVEGLDTLTLLKWIDLRGNNISYMEDINCLSHLPSLKTLFLQSTSGEDQNPVCRYPAYSNYTFNIFPSLSMLDGSHITLISAAHELETHLESIQPDLSKYPLVSESHWFQESDVSVDRVELRGEKIHMSSLPRSFDDVMETIEDVERLLSKNCTEALESADELLRMRQNKLTPSF